MPSKTRISVSELGTLIGTPFAPIIIDVCIDDDFNADPRLLPGSFRHPFRKIEDLIPQLRGKKVVVVCQKGLKLSQGAVGLLRGADVDARYLSGGNFAWRDAGEILVPYARIPFQPEGGTLWVTRERPKIDRIACPWLIRRFIDPGARFMFVEPDSVELIAEKFSATPFDIDGVLWSHRGERCTFDVMLEEFDLMTEPLKRLARIVRGADTNKHDLAPEASGLMAMSLGLSALYDDDLRQLEAGMALYDAFYFWARDAFNEGHDWKPEGKSQPSEAPVGGVRA
ncbi:MAG: chromate resistance protein [Rhizobiales bacterium]|nr:chromate resistance protein [Hyphomicrobiales bacterium]